MASPDPQPHWGSNRYATHRVSGRMFFMLATMLLLLDTRSSNALVDEQESPSISESLGNSPTAVQAGDFDNDGIQDLVVANYSSHDISILFGKGNGMFGQQSRYAFERYPTDVGVGDFDEDGNLDLIVVGTGPASLLMGLGRGVFCKADNMLGGGGQSVVVADLNLDGHQDLTFLNPGAPVCGVGSLGILMGRGNGTFASLARPTGINFPSGYPYGEVIGDFDLDGKPDIAFALTNETNRFCQSPGGLDLFKGHGDGTFERGTGVGTNSRACGIVSGDFNEDGTPDFVLREGSLDTVLGNSSGGPPTLIKGGFDTLANCAAVVADFNSDGHEDIATPQYVYLGDGKGNFNTKVFLQPGESPSDLALADFDGDGREDLTVINRRSNDFIVFLSKGDGNFDRLVDSAPPNYPPVAVASFEPFVECTPSGGAVVALDATKSSDRDSTLGTNDDIVAFEWIEGCGGGSRTILATGQKVDVFLPLGKHPITLRVVDRLGESNTITKTITVRDTTPPGISLSLAPDLLWPPNHRMVDVEASIVATDTCGPVYVYLESITSSDPDSASEDIDSAEFWTDDTSFRLRAERSVRGTGRIYTVRYRAVDGSGNVTFADSFVYVPASMGK